MTEIGHHDKKFDDSYKLLIAFQSKEKHECFGTILLRDQGWKDEWGNTFPT